VATVTWGCPTSLQSYWAVFGQVCTAHAYNRLPIKILTSLLDLATLIS